MLSFCITIVLLGILDLIYSAPIDNSTRAYVQPQYGGVIDLTSPQVKAFPISQLNFTSMALINEDPVQSFSDGISTIERDDDDVVVYILNKKEDMGNPKYKKFTENKKSVFYFKETKSSVYYDESQGDWYELQAKERQTSTPKLETYPELLPVSSCLDSSYGSGGSISVSYSLTLTMSNSLAIGGSFNIHALTLAISAAIGTKVAGSFTASSTYTCLVGKGEYGQLLIEPFVVEIPEMARSKTWYKFLKGFVTSGQKADEMRSFKMIAFHKPNHYCMIDTDTKNLQCAAQLGGSKIFHG
ncbi:uncharacterized protein RJT20DRAFT_27460 [Scheffersomyces xylosifermentans]|uniref:uncharacterized protein n=1 Tax=Scheffersomyces xylosifermentans TaxID=1304137 RepID=UPI00315D13B6